MVKRLFHLVVVGACMLCTAALADPVWVVDPGSPGPDLPPQGRSLFDHLTISNGEQVIPYPFEQLVTAIGARLDADSAYLGQPVKQVLIPLGRSLQREAAAPDFFHSPRIVLAVDSEPAADAGLLLRDRLFIGYLEAADVLEIISYNEQAARFEFQVVRDYRAGGQPQVTYARRVVCMACHQNAAPIFARPLWDETNASREVADRLEHVGSDFHGIPVTGGVDIAYAIDNATDRANAFALTQKLWLEACGLGDAADACRRALFIRTLQSALNGGRGFERVSDSYQSALRAVMSRRSLQAWPDGLLISDADIVNRRPLAGLATPAGGDDADRLLQQADVDGRSEPLMPRPAAAVWTPEADDLVERAVTGLTQFIAAADLQRIDQRLAQSPTSGTSLSADCDAVGTPADGNERIKVVCQGADIELRGLIQRDAAGNTLSGRMRSVRIADTEFGALSVGGSADGAGVLHVTLQYPESPLRPRFANADALAGLTLRRHASGNGTATIEVQRRHESVLLSDAVERTAGQSGALFEQRPFLRAALMPALFRELGITTGDWCCADDGSVSPPRVAQVTEPPDDPLLAPFFKVCGACHRSDEPFPPNFLAGSAGQARRTLAHCAERIQYRLGMWDLAPSQRPKSTMPPHHAGSLEGARLGQWMDGLLKELREALTGVTSDAGVPLPSTAQALDKPYYTLRRCLPAG